VRRLALMWKFWNLLSQFQWFFTKESLPKLEFKKKIFKKSLNFQKKKHEAFFRLSRPLMAKLGLIDLPMITTLATSQNWKNIVSHPISMWV
jgi:hypothetical protein